MLEAERNRLKKFVDEHEVDMSGVPFVNAIWVKHEIDEIFEKYERDKYGPRTAGAVY